MSNIIQIEGGSNYWHKVIKEIPTEVKNGPSGINLTLTTPNLTVRFEKN